MFTSATISQDLTIEAKFNRTKNTYDISIDVDEEYPYGYVSISAIDGVEYGTEVLIWCKFNC